MQPAEPRELGLFEAGNRAEHARLLAMFQLGLKPDHVPQRAERIVLTELHHGIRLHARPMRVRETDRLHRSVAQRLGAALGHHLDGQAAFEIGGRLRTP